VPVPARRRESNVSPPPARSAPAQNPRPAPVTITARTTSSLSAASRAAISSLPIWGVQALSRSGRFRVISITRSVTCTRICSYSTGVDSIAAGRPPRGLTAVLAREPFSDPDWIFERKLDGISTLVSLN